MSSQPSASSARTRSTPRFASALSTEGDSPRAIREAIAELDAGLGGTTADLVIAFATHHHGPALEGLGPALRRSTGARVVLGFDHPNYSHMSVMPDQVRQVLARDFA